MTANQHNHNSRSDPHWLAHEDNTDRSHWRRRPSAREKSRENLLRDWYGTDLAREEILAHQKPCASMAEAVDGALQKMGMVSAALLGRLQQNWPDIVGRDIAHYTAPVALRKHCLDIEVSHPMWLYTLRTTGEAQVKTGVREFTQGKVTKLHFVPAGRARYNR